MITPHDKKRIARIQNALHRRYSRILSNMQDRDDNANTGHLAALLTKVKKRIAKTPSPRRCNA